MALEVNMAKHAKDIAAKFAKPVAGKTTYLLMLRMLQVEC